MTPTTLLYVPAVQGAIRTFEKTRIGSVTPAAFKDGDDVPFIGIETEEKDVIVLHRLMPTLLNNYEAFRLLATRTLRLISALLAKGVTVDAEIVRECWIASNLHPRVGADGERRENARGIVRHHLGQDVVKYLRDQERYAS